MRFYNEKHRYYCGIDLHARSMYVCVLDAEGEIVLHRNMAAAPELFLQAIAPYREDIVVGVECIFTWYWLADLCDRERVPFVLGHALYMKAIHGGKTKNDRINSKKIATLLRGGMFPMAYAYPAGMRSTRDLMRRRTYLVRRRADLLAHIQNTTSQHNLPAFGRKIAYPIHRDGVAEAFPDPQVRKGVEIDLELIDHLDLLIGDVEHHILRTAKTHNPQALYRLRTVHGIGKVLSLVILYEIHDIARFPSVKDFASYARLVKCPKESAGKRSKAASGRKIGNVHLKWAFSEAAVSYLHGNPEGMKYKRRLEKKYGKAKALSLLAHKLGRTVYFMLTRDQVFDPRRFLAT